MPIYVAAVESASCWHHSEDCNRLHHTDDPREVEDPTIIEQYKERRKECDHCSGAEWREDVDDPRKYGKKPSDFLEDAGLEVSD